LVPGLQVLPAGGCVAFSNPDSPRLCPPLPSAAPASNFLQAGGCAMHAGDRTLSLDPLVQPLLLETLLALRDTGQTELFSWFCRWLRDEAGHARLLMAENRDEEIVVRLKPWAELALLHIRDLAADSRLSPSSRAEQIQEVVMMAGL
jgi:hypothetical protein